MACMHGVKADDVPVEQLIVKGWWHFAQKPTAALGLLAHVLTLALP